jgi:hypothetical protein
VDYFRVTYGLSGCPLAGVLFKDERRLLGRSRLCEDVNGLAASIAKEEFNGMGAGVSYVFDPERHNYTQDPP